MARRRREAETASIRDVTHEGRGIADIPGKRVFVAGALAGERVRFVRRKRHRNYDVAELLEILEPSPARIDARCAVFGRCGGCSLQHVGVDQQREIKAGVLRDNLQRLGGVEPRGWLAPIVDSGWHYRRRARLAVKSVAGKGRVLVGFRERHAPFVTDMRRCEILVHPVDELIEPLSELIGGLTIAARIPQIEVAVADNATALVFRVLDPPSTTDTALLAAFGEAHDIRVYLQPGGLDSVRPLAGDPGPLYYDLPAFDLRIEFGPTDFVQVNAAVNRAMVVQAVDRLDPGAGDRVLDLYCGIGNFSLPLATRAEKVTGIEGDPVLVDRARHNARRNGIDNAGFLAADLAAIDGGEAWLRAGCDRLLLDPARSGAAEVVGHIDRLAPGRIVYVSCHPGTLARDAGRLVNEAGYTLDAAGIIDMFPHTAHVESIAVFSR